MGLISIKYLVVVLGLEAATVKGLLWVRRASP
jgi:hypothetical protein